MTPALADEAALAFAVALTVLLAASLLTVIRQPPWVPPPPAGDGPHHPEDTPRGPGRDSRPQPAEPLAGRPRAAEAAARQGRHASGPPDETARTPLPVRAPGQSGWTAPVAGGAGRPDTGWHSPVAGGPPWGPAQRPPDVG
jgi:hypothetical protein